jgi:hypothetical protein
MAPRKKTQFQFVNIENPKQSTQVETRQLVRRHVMQHHLRQRLEEQSRAARSSRRGDTTASDILNESLRASLGATPAPSLMCNCFGSFEETVTTGQREGSLLAIETCQICGRLFVRTAGTGLQTPPVQPRSPSKEIFDLGSGRSDPFDTYAIEMRPADHGLLDHLVVTMTPAISPVDMKYGSRTHLNKSFNFMISDPAVLHSSLAVASFHFDFVSFPKLVYRPCGFSEVVLLDTLDIYVSRIMAVYFSYPASTND